ncbi:MAG: Membrane protein [candidate division TM6 bacterium GW2011_GWE2_41_16]|nr:MAG: Membrane protein [candidate division TM6 bacterium GW2011_GWE2_41_16]
MNRLQSYARVIKFLFLFVYMPLVLITGIIKWAYMYIMPLRETTLPLSHICTNLLAGAIDGFSLVLLSVIAYYCARLLDQYKAGETFSIQVLNLYTKINRLVLLWALYNPIKNTALELLKTIHNPAGNRIIAFSFTSQDMYHILIVGLLLILSSIMQAACELKEEHDLTV